jgi:hypothetical protein
VARPVAEPEAVAFVPAVIEPSEVPILLPRGIPVVDVAPQLQPSNWRLTASP